MCYDKAKHWFTDALRQVRFTASVYTPPLSKALKIPSRPFFSRSALGKVSGVLVHDGVEERYANICEWYAFSPITTPRFVLARAQRSCEAYLRG